MFTFFSLSFPAGLALYWIVSNIFSIVVQYYVTGWGGLNFKRAKPTGGGGTNRDRKLRQRLTEESTRKGASSEKPSSDSKQEGLSDGKSGDIRQDSGGGNQKSLDSIKRWFGRG
jgi:YidC/Oxa1 family membrane protein insertase